MSCQSSHLLPLQAHSSFRFCSLYHCDPQTLVRTAAFSRICETETLCITQPLKINGHLLVITASSYTWHMAIYSHFLHCANTSSEELCRPCSSINRYSTEDFCGCDRMIPTGVNMLSLSLRIGRVGRSNRPHRVQQQRPALELCPSDHAEQQGWPKAGKVTLSHISLSARGKTRHYLC